MAAEIENVRSLTINSPPDARDSPVPDPPDVLGITQAGWVQVAVIAALMALLFWPNLRRLWDKTNPFYGEPNWGHAICVPVIGLYYLYLHRQSLRAAPCGPHGRVWRCASREYCCLG